MIKHFYSKTLIFSVLLFFSESIFAQTYNADDLKCLNSFFNEKSIVEDKINAQILGIENCLDTPSAWPGYTEKDSNGAFVWSLNKSTNEYRLERLLLSKLEYNVKTKLSGNLVLANSLKSVDISATSICSVSLHENIDGLWTFYANNCPHLKIIDFEKKNSGFTYFRVNNCPNIEEIKLNAQKACKIHRCTFEITNNPKLSKMTGCKVEVKQPDESSVVINNVPLSLQSLPWEDVYTGCIKIDQLLPFVVESVYNKDKNIHEVTSDMEIDLNKEIVVGETMNEVKWYNEKNKEVKPLQVGPGKYKLSGKKIDKGSSYYVKIINKGMSPVKEVKSLNFLLF